MRNTWLVVQREYLERVRSKAFVISTLLVPAFMFLAIALPVKFATMKAAGTKKIVLATPSAAFGQTYTNQLMSAAKDNGVKFDLSVDTNVSPQERDALRQKVASKEIDGFLWAPQDALDQRKVTFTGRETGDFIASATMRRALTSSTMELALTGRGMTSDDVTKLTKPFDLDNVQLQAGKESKQDDSAVLFPIMMAVFLYTTLIMYGITIMRSVVEEKSSRILEVLMASCTPRALMAGKILGVGAAGLTQTGIWALAGAVIGFGPMAAIATMRDKLGINLSISPMVLAFFPVFFILGFLLNSAGFAAIGAAVNSDQEGQQFNMIFMMPMIFCMFMLNLIIRQPNAPMSVFFSLFPFTAPILMFLRIAIQTPPLWQIAACIAIMVATTWGMMSLCARIYRIGILMYGKRPTLPEILKWMKYA